MTDKITNHVEQALALFVDTMQDKPNFVLLLSSIVAGHQKLEDTGYDMLTKMQLGTAEGAQLDLLGKIVLQPRNSQSDADYVRSLGARIAANNSEGTIEDILRVARGVLDTTASIEVSQHYPKALTVSISNDELTDAVASILVEFLLDAVSGETRLFVEYHTLPVAETYTLGSATQLSAIHAIGATVLSVDSTAGFDASGDLTIDKYGGSEEDVSYTSKSDTQFFGVLTVNGHTSGEVRQANSTNLGLSDTASPTSGGGWASATEG